MSLVEISPSDITFVLQGSISNGLGNHDVSRSIASIRKHFSGSVIILSTWESEPTDNLDVDVLVVSKDPGSYPLFQSNEAVRNNVNRQIVSSSEGLRRVQTKFAVKMRTDLYFDSSALLSYLSCLSGEVAPEGAVFDQRVLVVDRITIDPRKVAKLPFHPCDYFSAGLTSDVKKLWDRNLLSESDAFYFQEVPELKYLARYRCEAFIWMDFLREQGLGVPNDSYEISEEIIQGSIRSFVLNLVPLGQGQLGLVSGKHPQGFDLGKVTMAYTLANLYRDSKKLGIPFPRYLRDRNLFILMAWEQLLERTSWFRRKRDWKTSDF
jgi:hypothetical protein